MVHRSRRGDETPGDRVCLCRAHHQRGEQGDLMVVRGKAPLGLRWAMGRKGRGGVFVNEARRVS